MSDEQQNHDRGGKQALHVEQSRTLLDLSRRPLPTHQSSGYRQHPHQSVESRLILPRSAFARAHPKSRKEKAIGTAQPEWMTRDAGFRTPGSHVSAVHRNGVLDAAEGGGRWGI